MRAGFPLLGVGIILGLAACSPATPASSSTSSPPAKTFSGINPNIKPGAMSPQDTAAVSRWIKEATALMQSPEFEINFRNASQQYPELFVSQKEDLVPSETVLARLKTQDPRLPDLWWPEVFIVLTGQLATRTHDRTGFGFDAARNAGAGPILGNYKDGEIELGRLHFARYTQGDTVEKSCALNTMVHEISHTLSDKPDLFWMHILDSEEGVTPPQGVYEASYFIGTIAQCTYLETAGRIAASEFQSCMSTFSAPSLSSRFRSIACDDFPDDKPITPQGRLTP